MFIFFQKLINNLLSLDPAAAQRASALGQRCLSIHVHGLALDFAIVFNAGEMRLTTTVPESVDTRLSGSPGALLALLLSSQPLVLLHQKRVTVEGDVALLQSLKQLLLSLNIDWEEYLSQWVGDIPARLIGNAARYTKRWGKQSANVLRNNITEYLQEELICFPAREQAADFMTDVDVLRDDVERLQARYERLLQYVTNKDSA